MTGDRLEARDLTRTKADILAVATQHFARKGYFGARVDEIAAETATTKRMIYYGFGGKDGLFAACLQAAYRGIRDFEESLHLEGLSPAEAIETYVRGTIRYHEAHPELALLVRSENVQGGEHLTERDRARSTSVVTVLEGVLARGRGSGEFRADVSALEVHFAVTALANYRITNEHTFGSLFGFPTRDPGRLDHDLDQYAAMMLGWLRNTQ